MYCHKCGREIPDDAIFCPICGTKLYQNDIHADKSAKIVRKRKMWISLTVLLGFVMGGALLFWSIILGKDASRDRTIGDDKNSSKEDQSIYYASSTNELSNASSGSTSSEDFSEDLPSKNHYIAAESYLKNGHIEEAALEYGKAGDYEDAREKSLEVWHEFTAFNSVSIGDLTGYSHIAALKSDGTAIATGQNYEGQCDVSKWSNLISICTGYKHTVGLKGDGTVVATGDIAPCNVADWENIVSIAASNDFTAGLKSDGTVVIAADEAYSKNLEYAKGWNNIIAIWANDGLLFGKSIEGNILCNENTLDESKTITWEGGSYEWNGEKKIEREMPCGPVRTWDDIVQIYRGDTTSFPFIVGLKSDGTVQAVGENKSGQCDVSDWTDIVSIAAGLRITVGLKSDGTVVCTGSNASGQGDVFNWDNIVAIDSDSRMTIGLKADGTVLLIGEVDKRVLDEVSTWQNIMIPKTSIGIISKNDNGQGASSSTWKEAYRQFIEGNKYLKSGEDYDTGAVSEDFQSISFGLYDLDLDNIPEMIINNGYESYAENAYYVYQYSDGKVTYIGMLPGVNYTIRYGKGFPGFFIDGGHGGYFWTDYYYKADSKIKQENVSEREEGQNTHTYLTDKEILINAENEARQTFDCISVHYYPEIGWEKFAKIYEY